PAIHTLSLHDALPISLPPGTMIGKGEAWPGGQIISGALLDANTGRLSTAVTRSAGIVRVGRTTRGEGVSSTAEAGGARGPKEFRSEEHTSELQSPCNL